MRYVRDLSEQESASYALMLMAGMPGETIAALFLSGTPDEQELRDSAKQFAVQAGVRKALLDLTGGVPWHKLTPEKRLELALEKHYAEMAYFLWSHNYSKLDGLEKSKADDCRKTLESKLAGTAGQNDPLARFYEELIEKQRRQKLDKALPRV